MDSTAIFNHILSLILYLYGSLDLSRKVVQDVISYIIDFNKTVYLASIKRDILDILKNDNISDYSLLRIEECFEQHGDVFHVVDSESKRFNILRGRGFIDVKQFFIGTTFKHVCEDDSDTAVPENMFGFYIPLKESLKIFLQIPGLFNQILSYRQKLSKPSQIITNILQARLCVQKYTTKFMNNNVLPLYIFYDDLEVGNALGSHAGTNKLGAIYVSIACLPPTMSAKLSSIICSTLFYTSDKKKRK